MGRDMPGIVTIIPRKLYKEDFDLASSPGDTETVEVLGAGSVELTKFSTILLDELTPASNDANAASAGVLVGQMYYNTTNSKPHTRMS
jgi:hypothetical protein